MLGKDAEAAVLAHLVQPAGKDVFLSLDDQTSRAAERVGHTARRPGAMPHLAYLVPDSRRATRLFFHRHEAAVRILRKIFEPLASNNNRAQGSRAFQAS